MVREPRRLCSLPSRAGRWGSGVAGAAGASPRCARGGRRPHRRLRLAVGGLEDAPMLLPPIMDAARSSHRRCRAQTSPDKATFKSWLPREKSLSTLGSVAAHTHQHRSPGALFLARGQTQCYSLRELNDSHNFPSRTKTNTDRWAKHGGKSRTKISTTRDAE